MASYSLPMATATAKPSPTAATQLKPCNICNGESCIVIPSIASQQHLCLLHYYTTGTHNRNPNPSMAATSIAAKKKKSSSLLIENQRTQKQLTSVQELFAEAFLDLQKEIGEESARAFQSAADAEDPLALLLDSTSTSSSRSAISRSFQKQYPGRGRPHLSGSKKSTNQSHEGEGGFIREAVLPERLRKLQNPNVSLEGFASKYNKDSTTISKKRPATRSNKSATKPSNPYQRKQKPSMNVWNQVLDFGNKSDDKKKPKKTKWEDIEKEMINNITSGNSASTKTCTCGSTNVEINGNVTSRNHDMTKGEVWGMKDRAEVVVERCCCTTCGKTWNEE